MAVYDFSIAPADFKNAPIAWQKSVFGFKVFDSIMAKILYINPNNLTATTQFLEKNKVGVGYDYSKLHKIKYYLSKIKTRNYQDHFENYITNYNEKKLIDFILN